MRHFTISSVPMLMFVTTLTTGSVVTAQSACSTQTLSGDYGAKIEGTRLTNNDTVRTLALFRFDGHGGPWGPATGRAGSEIIARWSVAGFTEHSRGTAEET